MNDKPTKLVFIIGPPRSGSTLLQRILSSHKEIGTHPEPHLVTPLAHLGVWASVDKAPYDHINAAEAQREFVSDLPGGKDDYWAACRAYLDVLYSAMAKKIRKPIFLDKTPAYALVLPFLTKVYPDARYIVLTRHPLAVFCSYANSFFEGDAKASVEYNNILGRYVPAMGAFLRQKDVPFHHVKYEDLVSDPQTTTAKIFAFLGVENQPEAVNYGDHEHEDKSFGDPKVRHHRRPTTSSVNKWAVDLASNAEKEKVARRVVADLDPQDIRAWGYDKKSLFAPMGNIDGKGMKQDFRWMFDSYRIKRKIFLSLRKDIHTNALGKTLRKVRYYCDVLLRD